ncbi:hypothetical protein WR30_12685 [Burkholderia contaminans FFH2055]|nr:hypothetical protein WR30_12685 [Burkholderia contaminans FFH2055]
MPGLDFFSGASSLGLPANNVGRIPFEADAATENRGLPPMPLWSVTAIDMLRRLDVATSRTTRPRGALMSQIRPRAAMQAGAGRLMRNATLRPIIVK